MRVTPSTDEGKSASVTQILDWTEQQDQERTDMADIFETDPVNGLAMYSDSNVLPKTDTMFTLQTEMTKSISVPSTTCTR